MIILPPRQARAADEWRPLLASGQLVDITKVDPTILVELRYATARNGYGASLYPKDFPCLMRPETARALHDAQRFLREHGCRLKIWDAYRPVAAQRALWKHTGAQRYVANPESGRGSLHCQGIAVDVTLVDAGGREVLMPTDFDRFEPLASGLYNGKSQAIDRNLRLLQYAMMGPGGFTGLSIEWWHFALRNWKDIKPFKS